MHEEETLELYDSISHAANTGSINEETIRELFQWEHNALQRRIFFSLVVPIVEEMANSDSVDARNEKAVEKAQEMLRD